MDIYICIYIYVYIYVYIYIEKLLKSRFEKRAKPSTPMSSSCRACRKRKLLP